VGRFRAFAALSAVFVVFISVGACVSPLFATKQASDCCHRGRCAPNQDNDSCCKGAMPSATHHFQVETKFSISHEPTVALLSVDSGHALNITFDQRGRSLFDIAMHSPPDPFVSLSLPLLI
jgi:hypothetical protein